VNHTAGMSQLTKSSNAYKKGNLSTTERVNRLFQLSAEMNAHDLATDGDDEVHPEDVVVTKMAPNDLCGGIIYAKPGKTTNDAVLDVFGVNDDGESDSDLDGEEEDNGDAVGDEKDSLCKALACYNKVGIAPGCHAISNSGGGNIFRVYHKELTKSFSLAQSKFKLFVCGLGFCQIVITSFFFFPKFSEPF
jgi:hypothetical protein